MIDDTFDSLTSTLNLNLNLNLTINPNLNHMIDDTFGTLAGTHSQQYSLYGLSVVNMLSTT